tara:strand:- start:21 stop:215 length:195 start_codon:yes stop_codon:yes gene_type:complete
MTYEIKDKDCNQAAKEFSQSLCVYDKSINSAEFLQFKEDMKVLFHDQEMFEDHKKSAKILYLFD